MLVLGPIHNDVASIIGYSPGTDVLGCKGGGNGDASGIVERLFHGLEVDFILIAGRQCDSQCYHSEYFLHN